MSNIPIGTPIEYPNISPIQQNVVYTPQAQSEEELHQKGNTSQLKCLAISNIVISSTYPWLNWVLWGTIIAHIVVLPLMIITSIFALKSIKAATKYSQWRVHRAVVLCLGIVGLTWLVAFFILNSVVLSRHLPGLGMFLAMMVGVNFTLLLQMIVCHANLFTKKNEIKTLNLQNVPKNMN